MNSEEQSQDFERLQHLLKLKRYEQPPPRYFSDFSSKVIAHIQSDTSVRRFETADDLISRTPWLRRLWRKLESQPALSGALATVACGIMVAGVFLMEETKPQDMSFNPAGEQGGLGNRLVAAPALGNINAAGALPQAFSTNVSPFPNSLNLFEQMGPGNPAQQVNYGRPLLAK